MNKITDKYIVCKQTGFYLCLLSERDPKFLLRLDAFLEYAAACEDVVIKLEHSKSAIKGLKEFRSLKLLSIDAWKDPEGGWQWNQWYHVDDYVDIDYSPRAILKWLRENGRLSEKSIGRCTVENDGYNYVIKNRKTDEPYFAIEHCGVYL